jgi:hypothetical protein
LIDGGMRFVGQEVHWLVVAGKKAWMAGTGTIDGVGRYGIAVDLDLTPNANRVRVRVWDREDGDAVLYDSQPGEALDAAPTTPLIENHVVIPN